MAKVIAGMSMSLDGFVADEDGSVDSPPPPVPPEQDEELTFTFVTDGLASAVTQAARPPGTRR